MKPVIHEVNHEFCLPTDEVRMASLLKKKEDYVKPKFGETKQYTQSEIVHELADSKVKPPRKRHSQRPDVFSRYARK